ncbi:hypothetical protein GC173_12300 [bacterium]|nr:hypothetical protein [bacterium]
MIRTGLLIATALLPLGALAQPYTVTATANPMAEGNVGSSQLQLRFTVDPPVPTGSQVRVRYQAQDGIATGVYGAARSGRDYVPLVGTLTFAGGGASTLTVNLSVLNDTVRESSELLSVNLTVLEPLGGVTLVPDRLPVTILNDDPLPEGYVFGVSGSGTFEFDPGNVLGSYVERPGVYTGAIGGAFLDSSRFALVATEEDGVALTLIDPTSLLPTRVGLLTALASGETVGGIDYDRSGDRLLALSVSGDAPRLYSVDVASAALSPLAELSIPADWLSFAIHPITGALYAMTPGEFWRADTATGIGQRVATLPASHFDATPVDAAFSTASGRLYIPGNATDSTGTISPTLWLVNHLSGAVRPLIGSSNAVASDSLLYPVSQRPVWGILPPASIPATYVSFAADVVLDEPLTDETPLPLSIVTDPPIDQPLTVTVGAIDGAASQGRNYRLPQATIIALPANSPGTTTVYTVASDGFPSGALDFAATLTVEAPAAASIDLARVSIQDTNRVLRYALEDHPLGGGDPLAWSVRHIDPPGPQSYTMRGTVLEVGASPNWTLPLIELTSADGSPLPDLALETPSFNFSANAWVRIEWRQALEYDRSKTAILPLLEYSVDGGNRWQPLLAPTSDSLTASSAASPAEFVIDASNAVALRSDVRFRIRLRDLPIDRFLIDDWRILTERIPAGHSIALLRPQSLLEGDTPTSRTVTVDLVPPPTAAASLQFNSQSGTASEGVDYLAPGGEAPILADAAAVLLPLSLLGNSAAQDDRSFRFLLTPSVPEIAVLSSPGDITIEDEDPFIGRPAMFLAPGGVVLHTTSEDPAIARRRVHYQPFLHLTDADYLAGGDDRVYTVEQGGIPRFHQFDAATGELLATSPLALAAPQLPIVGFAWDPAESAWACLLEDSATYSVALLERDGASERSRRSLTLSGVSAPLEGLAFGPPGVVYTASTGGATVVLCRIDRTSRQVRMITAAPFEPGGRIAMHYSREVRQLFIAKALHESVFGSLPSTLAIYDESLGEFDNTLTIGNSLVDFTGMTLAPQPIDAATNGWMLQ